MKILSFILYIQHRRNVQSSNIHSNFRHTSVFIKKKKLKYTINVGISKQILMYSWEFQ